MLEAAGLTACCSGWRRAWPGPASRRTSKAAAPCCLLCTDPHATRRVRELAGVDLVGIVPLHIHHSVALVEADAVDLGARSPSQLLPALAVPVRACHGPPQPDLAAVARALAVLHENEVARHQGGRSLAPGRPRRALPRGDDTRGEFTTRFAAPFVQGVAFAEWGRGQCPAPRPRGGHNPRSDGTSTSFSSNRARTSSSSVTPPPWPAPPAPPSSAAAPTVGSAGGSVLGLAASWS